MDNSTFLESDFCILSSFYTSAQKLLPVSPWINKPPLQSQLYLNLCLSAWQLLNSYSAWSSCHRCIKALELGHFQVTGKYDVIIYIPSSAEWGSFLSLGESCLSAMSLTEIILTITRIIVYLEGKEWWVAKKNLQAKPEAIVHCTTWLRDCYHMDMSTMAVTLLKGRSQMQHGEVQSSLGAGPVVGVPGEVPTCSSQPRHHSSVGLPDVLRRTGTETAELFSQPGLICLHAHCSELATQTRAVCLTEKQVTVQPNKRPKLPLVNRVRLCQTAAALLQQDNTKPRTKCWL